MISKRDFLIGSTCTIAALATTHVFGKGWENKANLPLRTQEIYPCVHNGSIYVAGGLSPDVPDKQSSISSRVSRYDPTLNQWMPAPSLPEPRHHPILISTKGHLYLLGGFVLSNSGRWRISRDVLHLDEKHGAWLHISTMPHEQSETVATVLGSNIHLVSGRTPKGEENANWIDHTDTNLHQVYDVEKNTWSTGIPVPTARNSATGAVYKGQWFVIGGRKVNGGNLGVNERFDPTNGKWTTMAPLPQPSAGLASAIIDDSILVFGGEYFEGSGGVYKKVWQYNPSSDNWLHVSDMPVPRHGLGAVSINNKAYVVGGATGVGGKGTSSRLSVFSL